VVVTKPEVQEMITRVLGEVSPGLSDVGVGDDLLDRDEFDSLTLEEFVVRLTSQFGIEICQADINEQNFASVSRVSDYLLRRQ
jgi:acyl carrier protein